ncbi:MAG: DUF2017 family protein [Acidimicrobiia bacterium]
MSPKWRRFRKGSGDSLILSLAPEEAELLSSLPTELREVFDGPLNDVAGQRLFPVAYLDPTEEEAEIEYRAMVHPDLLRQRLDSLALVASSLERATLQGEWMELELGPDDVQAWLGILNDVRLVLGTRLGITEDDNEIQLDDPRAGAYGVYSWLTYLQGELIDQLLH